MPVKCEEFGNTKARCGGENVREAFTRRSYRIWVKTPFRAMTVPVDRSETARRGIEYAIQLAHGGGVLHFCSVVDIVGACSAGAGPIMTPAMLTLSLEADAKRVCSDAVGIARKNDITADGSVIHGAIVPAVAQYVIDTRSDAVVIGTHARHGLSRIVFGSITESLLRTSDVPLVVAHADDVIRTSGPITVAVDGSAAARAALATAIELAQALGESLSLVNVADEGRREWDKASLLLDDAADTVRAADIAFELVTIVGRAAEVVVDSAQRRLSSMIVVGTDVHSSIARFVLGSVAATILERARIPVAVVPHHDS